ncbi:hypothetical protein HZS_1971 [Henneguya salminicola]|nr:hypothetical protein HZS_1971 [Henneguya salminicola]
MAVFIDYEIVNILTIFGCFTLHSHIFLYIYLGLFVGYYLLKLCYFFSGIPQRNNQINHRLIAYRCFEVGLGTDRIRLRSFKIIHGLNCKKIKGLVLNR